MWFAKRSLVWVRRRCSFWLFYSSLKYRLARSVGRCILEQRHAPRCVASFTSALLGGQVGALILCHTRELAYQICHEFERFSAYLPDVNVKVCCAAPHGPRQESLRGVPIYLCPSLQVFFGGMPVKQHKELLKNDPPNIVVGTPGRVLDLVREIQGY